MSPQHVQCPQFRRTAKVVGNGAAKAIVVEKPEVVARSGTLWSWCAVSAKLLRGFAPELNAGLPTKVDIREGKFSLYFLKIYATRKITAIEMQVA